jgi:hypothetical protein
MNRYLRLKIIPNAAFALLTSCAAVSPAPLTADNPASPSGPAAPERPFGISLGADPLTKKTHQLLEQAKGSSIDQ